MPLLHENSILYTSWASLEFCGPIEQTFGPSMHFVRSSENALNALVQQASVPVLDPIIWKH